MSQILKNENAYPVTWKGVSWQAGEQKEIPNHVPYSDLGLTLVGTGSLAGDVDPVLYHNAALTLSADSGDTHQVVTINIPYHAVFALTIIPDQTDAKDMFFKLGDSETYIKIPAGQIYQNANNGVLWKYAPYIKLYCPEGTTAYVLAEVM